MAIVGHHTMLEWALFLLVIIGGIAGAWFADVFYVRLVERFQDLPLDGEGRLDQSSWPTTLDGIRPTVDQLLRRQERAIAGGRRVQEQLDAIVAGMRDGVMIVDADTVIVTVNGPACDMLGTEASSVLGRPLVEIARDTDLIRVTRQTLAQGTEQATPIDYRWAGRQFDLRVLPVDQGEGRLAILVIQDVTELRQLEGVRRDFVANVSHELRTPLSAIRALVETLNDGALDDPTVAHDFLGRVIDEVDRLNQLIEDLLNLGRLESGRLPLRRSTVPVITVIEESLERVQHHARSAGIFIDIDVPTDLPDLTVDQSRIEQALVNLLNNAIKFSSRDGRVVVMAVREREATTITVQDFGSGILPDDVPRVFERFYKTDRARNSEGTGLGLAIAKHIVTAHGGTISVVSQYGEGSTFSVTLPDSDESAAA
jgi:two-component system phosphate regulon sensor histidine kinase PhoR